MPSFSKAVRELGRGFDIARRGGPRSGWRFVREEMVGNTVVRLRSLGGYSREPAVECNLCGWRGPRFLTHCAADYIDTACFCPSCRSYPRHRGFAWVLDQCLTDELRDVERGNGLRLVFAPESGMLDLFGEHVSRLEGVDLRPINEHVVRLEDLQRLSFADASVDFVSCFHVLEHVPDDRLALRELHRVLAPGGRIALCVPITFGRAETIDFGGPNPLMNDHCFDYGEDFVERVLEAGFSGRAFQLTRVVPRELHRRLGLVDELVLWLEKSRAGESPEIVPVDAPALRS